MRRFATIVITSGALVAGTAAGTSVQASADDKGAVVSATGGGTAVPFNDVAAQSKWRWFRTRDIKRGNVGGTATEGKYRYGVYDGSKVRQVWFRIWDARGGRYGGVQINFYSKDWRLDRANSGVWAVTSNRGGWARWKGISSYYLGHVCMREVSGKWYRNNRGKRAFKVQSAGRAGCWK
ncbi:hypothetical protein SMC26_18485 [Actinomadura fulvescens]|uniref:Secreted protein n=1 Tax=Actinomadura fulvescens TaxID=46160 RepID=A0ABN3QF84_9ACTN